MTSSEEAFKILLGWKTTKVSLYMDLVSLEPEELQGTTSESAQVVDVTDERLTISVAEGFIRDFHLLPGGVALAENVPHRDRNLFSKAVAISSLRGERLTLAERKRM
jgi:hypothetical protein